MRRSAGTGGGSMLRAVGRAVGAGLKDAVAGSPAAAAGGKAAKPARVVCVSSSGSSSPTSSPSFPASASGAAAAGWSSHPCFDDDEEWEPIGGEEEVEGGEANGNGFGLSERLVFGTAPSREEVEDAVSTLRQVFVPVTFSGVMEDGYPSRNDENAVDGKIISADTMQKSTAVEFPDESDADWIEPALHLYNPNTSPSLEHEKVFDAFHLLQINPSVQRMVVSLSSDKAVWDAVMKNEVVQEFRRSFHEDGGKKENSDEEPDDATGFLSWILDNTKAKVLEIIDKITKLVNEFFHSQEKDESKDFFDAAVRSSFMLSVAVFIIVVMSRVHRA